MSKRYLAIDLRGYPNEMYEEVYTPKQIISPTNEKAVEVCLKKSSDIRDTVRKINNSALIFVKGGNIKRNKYIVRQKKVNVLSEPYPIDNITAREAAENNIAFEINVEEIVRRHGYRRARHMQKLRDTIRIAKMCHTPLVITSGSLDEYTVKSPRTLVAFGKVLGLEYYESKAAIYDIPKMILQKEKK